ncbi:MAG: ATP-binding protein [Nitrososphaerota archaeon]
MPESKVNIRKMIRTQRESYQVPEGEEWRITISELIANSLDSKATYIKIKFNEDYPLHFTISCEDDGIGMNRENFQKYHDIYTITKSRESGTIGFAGIGAKLTIDLCERVITETKSNQEKYYYSNWFLPEDKEKTGKNRKDMDKCPQCGEVINSDMPHYHIFAEDQPREMGTHEGTYVKVVGLRTSNLTEKSLSDYIIGEYQYSMILKKVKIFLNGKELKPIVPINEDNEFEIENIRRYRTNGKFRFEELKFLEHFNFVRDSYKQKISENYDEEAQSGIDIVVYGKRIVREKFNIDFKTKAADSQYVYGYIECDQLIDIVDPSKDSFNRKSSLWKFFSAKVELELESWLRNIGKFDESYWKIESTTLNKDVEKFIDVLQKFPTLLDNLFSARLPRQNRGTGTEGTGKGEKEVLNVFDPTGGKTGNIADQGTYAYGTHGGGGVSNGPSVPADDEGPEKGVNQDSQGNISISEKKYTPRAPRLSVYIIEEPTKHYAVTFDSSRFALVVNSAHPGFKYSKAKGINANNLYIIMSILDYLINENDELSSNEEQKAETIYNLYSAMFS